MPTIVENRILCAWCRRLKDADGNPTGERLPMDAAASHGICKPCAARMQRQIARYRLKRVKVDLYRQRHPHRLLRDSALSAVHTD